MRKITEQSVSAFTSGKKFKSSNMEVVPTETGAKLLLHGNRIAERENHKLTIDNCGWFTATTRERINAVLKAFNVNAYVRHSYKRNRGIYDEKHFLFTPEGGLNELISPVTFYIGEVGEVVNILETY
jgi:hypothetical protein